VTPLVDREVTMSTPGGGQTHDAAGDVGEGRGNRLVDTALRYRRRAHGRRRRPAEGHGLRDGCRVARRRGALHRPDPDDPTNLRSTRTANWSRPRQAALNERLKAQGKPPVAIQDAAGNLEDDDLLEMVNAGLIPAIVVHDYMAAFCKKVFTDINVHDTVTLRTDASIAVPIRKNSPLLKAELNAFIAMFGLGTAFGNMMEKRYMVNTTFVKNAGAEAERKKFLALTEFFRKYSDQYQVDYLLMAAQGYQESQLNQDAKSHVGAVGVMQLMPATGKEMKVGDISQTETNIHAGVKYMRFMLDQYYEDEPMDKLNKGLFTFASYNAGPARVRQLRREAEKRGLDPNVWFGNVEQIASERIGRETVTYVSNIYKYYVAYKLISEERARRDAAKAAITSGGK
jgi:membrane-bound lytic murein transglycosylase MltF